MKNMSSCTLLVVLKAVSCVILPIQFNLSPHFLPGHVRNLILLFITSPSLDTSRHWRTGFSFFALRVRSIRRLAEDHHFLRLRPCRRLAEVSELHVNLFVQRYCINEKICYLLSQNLTDLQNQGGGKPLAPAIQQHRRLAGAGGKPSFVTCRCNVLLHTAPASAKPWFTPCPCDSAAPPTCWCKGFADPLHLQVILLIF